MSSELYYETAGAPPRGRRLEKLCAFLKKSSLEFDGNVQYTLTLTDANGEIIATGSMDHNVLKCIAVDESWRGEGLSAAVLSRLLSHAAMQGIKRLFLYTKPKNVEMFSELSFYPVAQTGDAALMENTKNGAADYAASLEKGRGGEKIGAIVMNANPFTKGHEWLVRQASSRCDTLHLFIVSEDRSMFPADVRIELARKAVADIENVIVHPTCGYLVSSATFPTYFLKQEQNPGDVQCMLDLELFCRWLVPALKITERFAGSEPFCPVTRKYNEAMRGFLVPRGIAFTQLERFERGGEPVSASRVRTLLLDGRLDSACELVAEPTASYLRGSEGLALVEKYRAAGGRV